MAIYDDEDEVPGMGSAIVRSDEPLYLEEEEIVRQAFRLQRRLKDKEKNHE